MANCPPESELHAYVSGRAEPDHAARVERHLAECDRCRASTAALREDEALAAKLRTAVGQRKDQATDASPPEAGHGAADLPTIPGFRLESEIGRGGMGVVYKAVQLSTHRTVALKVMLHGPFSDPSTRERFQREIELAAGLAHPGVVPVFDSGTHEGYAYFAMQYVDGVSLSQYVAARSLSLRERLDLFLQVCAAVNAAHQRGIIHRDLKPSNILVDQTGRAYVLDFGLAKALPADTGSLTAHSWVSIPGQILGTLPYMAPEQVLGPPTDVDVRTDVYALGVILYELLTGHYPYELSDSVPTALRTIAESEPRSPRKMIRTSPGGVMVDRQLESILLQALRKQKDDRYPTVSELARDVERYVHGEAIEARRDSGLYVLRKTLSRHRGYVAAALLTFAALSAVSLIVGRMYLQIRALTLETARTDFLEASIAFAQGRYSPALERLDQALEQNPRLSEAQLMRAQALLMMDRRDDSIAYLESLLRQDPNDWVAHYALADIYRLDPRQADYHRRRVWELRPDTAEACFVTSLGAKDDEAIDWLTQALAHDPEHFESRIRRAQLLLETGRWEEAERDADEAIRLHPGNDQGWWFKADALLRQRRYAAAIPLFSEAVKLHPRYPSLYGRATACRRLGRYRQALDDYDRIVKLLPDAEWNVRWILYHRATVHWILDDPESALADYERFAQYHPDLFWSDARRYLVLRELQHPREAQQFLELAAAKPTQDPWLRAVFEYLLGQRGAESLLSLADTDGRKCEANYYIAENRFQNGDRQTAREFYEACVATGVDRYVRSFEVTPSSEYELAAWRLATLRARDPSPN